MCTCNSEEIPLPPCGMPCEEDGRCSAPQPAAFRYSASRIICRQDAILRPMSHSPQTPRETSSVDTRHRIILSPPSTFPPRPHVTLQEVPPQNEIKLSAATPEHLPYTKPTDLHQPRPILTHHPLPIRSSNLCTSSGYPPQTQLAQGRAHPGRKLRAASVYRARIGPGHGLRGGQMPQHRGVLGRGGGYRDGHDHDHGRHLHERVQVRGGGGCKRCLSNAGGRTGCPVCCVFGRFSCCCFLRCFSRRGCGFATAV